jgi:hypothetical protein
LERPASIFVAVLGASNYTYAEATESQELEHWIGSHIRAFEFLGGVPKLVIPDNTRTGVNRACRYEPDLNRTYHELAMHYGVGVLPTRPYKPRDKAKVETGVQIVQRWIVAALRHRKFFSLGELNQAIRELLDKLNQRPVRKRPGCRVSLFQELDRPALGPLPRERFELQQWATARQHRLSRRDRLPLLQRALRADRAGGGDPLDADHDRDLSPRRARGFACP